VCRRLFCKFLTNKAKFIEFKVICVIENHHHHYYYYYYSTNWWLFIILTLEFKWNPKDINTF
jgi:hypothetical protein